MALLVTPFFDPDTFSYSYVVAADGEAAIIDPVLDYDAVAGRTSTASAERIIAHVRANDLETRWILETHVHADHLSAARHLQAELGGKTAIGQAVTAVQDIFTGVFNAPEVATDGSQFDHLLEDGAELPLGDTTIRVIHTPGHTPACVTYVVEDAAFVGDTLFMPDYGTARTDFPGGDAQTLYESIQKILALPDATRLFMCHDYGTATRKTFANETSVAEQRAHNIHLGDGVDAAAFAAFRNGRDKDLSAPRLLYPAVQFNMRGGAFPEAESNGQRYFKIPVKAS